MEKLLSITQKQGGKYAGTIRGQRKKNISYSFGSNRKCFLPTHRQTTKKTTYIRIYYLSQPIAGFTPQKRQLFSGQVNSLSAKLHEIFNASKGE